MSHILLIDLGRARDAGFTVNRYRDHHRAAANDSINGDESAPDEIRRQRAKEEFERATTPFPGG
jgi:hypothetical protein